LIEEPEQPDAPEEPQAEEPEAEEPQAEEPQAAEPQPAPEQPAPEQPKAGEEPDAPAAEPEDAAPAAEAPPEERRPRGKERGEKKDKPEVIPGEHLTPDITLGPEGTETDIEKLFAEQAPAPTEYPADDEAPEAQPEPEEPQPQTVARTPVELAAEARYRATGKRKTSVARVILRPGKGEYTINGRPLENYFPRSTLQHTARQPLETAGYQGSMDVVAKIHGGGVAAQADALRHGIARALIEVDPQLRTDLKRRGFLTRDARAKERKKAGLKKARKRPQFSKR
jgi:small subunit ribosomal protein S9